MDEKKPIENDKNPIDTNSTDVTGTTKVSNILDIGMNESNLNSLSGWANFVAVMNIIIGALNCLSCIGILPGVFEIIAGINLLNATTAIKKFTNSKEKYDLPNIFENFRKFFLYSGINFIIGIACGILFVIVYIVIIAYILSTYGKEGFKGLSPFGR